MDYASSMIGTAHDCSTTLFPAIQQARMAGLAGPTGPPVKSLREFIRDTLLDRIARGLLPTGQRVVEAVLVQEFAISSTPVREAIREMVAMGVLDAQNNKGATVREVKLDETIGAFEVRAALEALAARAAAPQMKGRCDDLRRVAEAIIAAARRQDFSAFQEHNQVFHRAIVMAAGNAVLLRTWDSLYFQVRTRWTMDYLSSFDPVTIAREHLPVVDALDQGLADLASALMAAHSAQLVEFLKTEHRLREAGAEAAKGARSRTKANSKAPKPTSSQPPQSP